MARSSTALLLIPIIAIGCAKMGAVCEGLCIHCDPTGGTVTLVASSARGRTNYDQLPPVTFSLPTDKRAMGPMPEAGLLLRADPNRKELAIYNAQTQSIQTIRCLSMILQESPQAEGRRVPEIDREKRTVTTFAPSLNKRITFTLSEEDFARPAESWKMGDVVRIYYQESGKAIRLMNVTKTRI